MNNINNIVLFKNTKVYSIVQPEIDKRNIRLYMYNDVVLTGRSMYYPDILFDCMIYTSYVLPIYEQSMSLQKKSYYEENGMIFNNPKLDINYNTIPEPVYFFIYNTENYYHFIYDTLPYLYCYFRLLKTQPNLKLLMNYNKNKTDHLPFVKETLQILNIEKNVIIHSDTNQYSKIYLSNSLTHDGLSNHPPRKEIFEIYHKMVQNVIHNFYSTSNIDHIYISRRTWIHKTVSDNIGTNYTTRRKMMNEDTLVDILKQHKYLEIFGEQLSMREKIKLLYHATSVIGAIGGTITNCVFCQPSCKIIVLHSPEFLSINSRMRFILSNNTAIFSHTELDCPKGQLSKNVRIEIIDPTCKYYKMLGEIIRYVEKDIYEIQLANNYVGFNQTDTYRHIQLPKNKFKTLDNGINSPWKVDITKLRQLL